MALATRCPHCQTTFRVAHDQLKLRAGLVRCGACKEIFNGVEHLLRPEEIQKQAPPFKSSVAPSPEQAILPAASVQQDADHSPIAQDDNLPAVPATDVPEPKTDLSDTASPAMPAVEKDDGLQPSPPVPEHQHIDPLQRMTLMDFTAFEEEAAKTDDAPSEKNSHLTPRSIPLPAGSELADSKPAESGPAVSYADSEDELSQAIDDLQRKPWRGVNKAPPRRPANKKESVEPGFIKHARRQKKYGRIVRIGMGVGSVALLIALSFQSLYAFRNTIAAQMPDTRPYLLNLCEMLDCKLNFPAQINKVSIETSELHSLPSSPNQFTLSVLLNNQADMIQAWPDIELTLNDTNEKPIARKVFTPDVYLSAKEAAAGFPAESEKTVKVSFELSLLKASGYRVYLFYP